MSSLRNLLLAALHILAGWIFWVSSVPPQPPALKSETKRQIPWLRTHAKLNSFLCVVSFMLPSAYEALMRGDSSSNYPWSLKEICPPSFIKTSPSISKSILMGYLLLFIGGYIRIISQRTLGKYFTWEISLKPDHKLCKIGPYSVVRHPGYLGLWIVRVAINIIQISRQTILGECLRPRYPLFFNLFIAENFFFTFAIFIWMSYRAKWEDDLLKKQFNGEWTNWAKKTPRIVPYIY